MPYSGTVLALFIIFAIVINPLGMNRIVLPILFVLLYQSLNAQITVELTVENAAVSTTCDDVFTAPDPLWQVEVENQDVVTYPQQGACFTALPNVQYAEDFNCPNDLPVTIEVCFTVFENDPLIPFGCFIDQACEEQACENITLPALGEMVPYTLSIPNGGSSGGTLEYTVSVNGNGNYNDLPCEAISLGTLLRGDTLGDATIGQYDNLCANDQNEPNPADDGGFTNSNGVWFEFTTGPNIGSVAWIEALGDPENTGDAFDVEVALYRSDNDTCTGNLELVSWSAPTDMRDVYMRVSCPEPDTRYYILVDGAFTNPGDEEGVFGLRLISTDVDDAPNERCDALMLGAVPEGDTISTDTFYGNYCADSNNDPFSPDFVVQNSVWFSFEAPPSGNVWIEANSNRIVDSIGIQLSLYRAFSTCSGFFQHLESAYDLADEDEALNFSCLVGGSTYYVMIDGDGANGTGMFSLDIYDAGDITPRTQIDTVICAGDSFEVGSSSYTEAGTYADTIILFLGCDSIINTNLTVLDPVSVNIEQIQPAIGEGNASGQAIATATGGNGGYTFEWCDGTTGPSNNNLVGGAECCVTVTDDFGCVGDTCFTMDFLVGIMPVAQVDSVACNGGNTGSIEFSAMGGIPPYEYSWEKTDLTLSGTGVLNEDNEAATLPDLTAGTYTISISDNFFDTTLTVAVEEPAALELAITGQSSASCFGFCDGSLSVEASGGIPPYDFSWQNGADTSALTSLCAGIYTVLLTDANGCELSADYEVEQPEEFIATIDLDQEVSCFGGSDGQLSVSTNGQPLAYTWNTGSDTDTISNRPTGTYSVTVTNTDGCLDTTEALLPQPEAPLVAQIELLEPITCFGFADGTLGAVPIGPGNTFDYAWSNGNTQANNNGLAAGLYDLTLTNERGCTDTASFQLGTPAALDFQATPTDLTCLSGENGGQLRIDTVTGGTSPFEYSLDGVVFGDNPNFAGLFAGSYSLIVRDSFGCEVEQMATVDPAPVLIVDAGRDTTINLGDTLTLIGTATTDFPVYTWIAADSSQFQFAGPSINVSPLRSTTYLLQVFDSLSLCTDQDVVNVKIERNRRVFIPTAFSPNGDGRNDQFFIHGDKALVNIPVMRIFNRTGSLVFERENIMPNNDIMGWDGTFRGEELNPGIFAYYAEITFADGATEVYSGDVMLMR